jgi:prepilin-type processing-associated H-X9-DG protein
LIELLMVMAIISVLAALLLPAMVRAKQQAHRIQCVNNIRQLNVSLGMYADDNEGEFPPRALPPNTWVNQLRPYYESDLLLVCPSDASWETRSYLMNGWNDYFETTLTAADYEAYKDWYWPHGIKESAIQEPTETITFGEKITGSFHYHMDYHQGLGSDLEEVEQARHAYTAQGRRTGVSNFGFADGSVRFLKNGHSLAPINLWAVTADWRNLPITTDPPPVAASPGP